MKFETCTLFVPTLATAQSLGAQNFCMGIIDLDRFRHVQQPSSKLLSSRLMALYEIWLTHNQCRFFRLVSHGLLTHDAVFGRSRQAQQPSRKLHSSSPSCLISMPASRLQMNSSAKREAQVCYCSKRMIYLVAFAQSKSQKAEIDTSVKSANEQLNKERTTGMLLPASNDCVWLLTLIFCC